MLETRKDKLLELQKYCDLETGEISELAFQYENYLFDKAIRMKSLNRKIRMCRKCQGMNIPRMTECAFGWGDLNSKIVFVGQSLHKPGVISGVPFIGGSGYMLDASLRLSGLLRKDVFITNAVHCHPENNRSSLETEKENCLEYLREELSIVCPRAVVALGNDAQQSCVKLGVKCHNLKHPASFSYSAPEQRVDWILKLSLYIDKILKS